MSLLLLALLSSSPAYMSPQGATYTKDGYQCTFYFDNNLSEDGVKGRIDCDHEALVSSKEFEWPSHETLVREFLVKN